MDLSKLTTLDYCLLWYLSGLVAMFIYLLHLNFLKKEEITIKIEDLVTTSLTALAGPILWLVPVFKFCFDLVENYGKVRHVVLWKNRRAKNKEILFGDNNDDDSETKTYPKL